MAKKPVSDNFDALGSVFDFLFTEASKPPEKRRPIKPTGVAGDSMFTDALFSSLEMPGAFVSDTLVGEFNGAIDIELGRVRYGEFGASVKFTSTSLIDLLKDPEKAFQKAVDTNKAIRKSQRAMFLGANVEDFITSAWAHKYGNLEARTAVYGASVANRVESYKIERALGQYGSSHQEDTPSKLQGTSVPGRFSPRDLNFMAERSFDLLGRKTFGNSWDTLSNANKTEFASLVNGRETRDIQTFLTGKYGASIPQVAANFGSAVGSTRTVDIFSGKLYKSLEGQNLSEKINDPTTSSEDREVYRKTYHILQRDRITLRNTVDNLKVMLNNAGTADEKRRLQRELKDVKNALRIVEGHSIFGRIGQIEGYVNSLNSVYGGVMGSNVVASILNGDLYNKNKNTIFLPISESKVGGVDILVEKKSPYKVLGKYNQVMTDVYYLTPRSLLRNFYNGEGFAYLLHKKLDKIKNLPGFSNLAAMGIDEKTLYDAFNGEEVDLFINDLLTQSAGILDPDDLEKLLKSSKTLKKLTHSFSFVSRMQEKLNKIFEKRLEKIRTRVADLILKNPKVLSWFVKTGADKLLKKWAMKGGLDVLIKSLLTAVVSALGLTMTPIVSAVLGAVTWVVSDFVMKALGVGLNILKWAAIGTFAILLVIPALGLGAIVEFNKETLSYRSETPGSILQCSLYEEVELVEGEEPWGDTVIPPSSGASCPLGTASPRCGQGFVDVEGWSHASIPQLMPVDISHTGYIYAPQFCDSGNCSITRIATIECRDGSRAGGVVELTASDGRTTYFFKMLHVKPLAGLGERLSGGQPVAAVQHPPEVEEGLCWTGIHLHLETKQNGGVVDPLALLQSFGCTVPSESGCMDP